MKTYLEVIELTNDIVTASGEEECCDYGCGTDGDQLNKIW